MLTVIASAIAVLATAVTAQNSTGPVANLGYAQYRGTVNESLGVTTYFGIKYAQPPVGELRFRAPVDIERNSPYDPSTVIDATQKGSSCIQGIAGFSFTSESPTIEPGVEDCLLMDILTPENPVGSDLAVMVQIHGGGYSDGDSESYMGYALVNQSMGNLIYVSIQYRLNAFGFLSSTEVRDNGDANAGLLDQRAALQWVQRNIRAFGGDPAKVTIIGGSAGGGSVMNQMILYGGETNPPFRAVISEYPWFQPYHNDSILEAQFRELLSASNCSGIECLRTISSDELNMASLSAQKVGYQQIPMEYGYGDFYWGPAVDGQYIKDLPSNEFKQGHFTKVPLLVDHDGYEGYIFSNQSETTISEENMDLQTVFPYAKQSFFTRLYDLYPPSDFNSTLFQRQQIFGDFIIDCPTYYMATATSDLAIPTWKLVFDAGTKLHGATVAFLFVTNQTAINNLTLSYIMKDWFLSFTTDLDPNVRSFTNVEKPYWPQYQTPGSANFSIMDVNYTMMGNVQDFDASPQCDFFHAQSYVVRN